MSAAPKLDIKGLFAEATGRTAIQLVPGAYTKTFREHVTAVDRKFQWYRWSQALGDVLQQVADDKIKRLMVFAPPRHGKLLADHTPVLTTKGWRTHGQLRPGDEVFHPSGKPIRVLAISPKGPADIRVEFANGAVIYCHEQHEWTVYDRGYRDWRTVETAHFLATTKFGKPRSVCLGDRSLFQLPPVAPLEFPEADLPMHPYVLGAWLGDGSSSKPCITHASSDTGVIDKVAALGYAPSRVFTHATTGVLTTYFGGERQQAGPFLRALNAIGVVNDKHIPAAYMHASVAQRLELLAGLIDTDGCTCKRTGRVHFSTTSVKLRDGVMELVRSFGWRAGLHECAPKLSTSGIQGKKTVYVIGFQPDRPLPLALERKLGRTIPAEERRLIGLRSVTRDPQGFRGRCITVDSPDGLYLVGHELVPTHNSYITTRHLPAYFIRRHPERFVGLCAYGDSLSSSFSRTARGFYLQSGGLLKGDSASVHEWLTPEGGGLWSAGVGGAITGRGFHLGIIDDPIKNAAESFSPTILSGHREWYDSTFNTREEPNGAIIIIQCMTGDTPVLMSDGTERPLAQVRPGDTIATYDNGRVATSKVLNWKNQGPDDVFEIRMKSGITVKANKRHPFLVCRSGVTEWVRLKHLRPGDQIVRVPRGERRAGRTEEFGAPLQGATSQPNARDIACPTTARLDGQRGTEPRRTSTPRRAETVTCATGTESVSRIITRFSTSKAASAPYAAIRRAPRTLGHTGAESSVLTTTTTPAGFEDSSATTATLPSATERRLTSFSGLPTTSGATLDSVVEIVPAGREDVFDIQVERTENFIANGLVSHNTRWSEDDLSGYVLEKEQEEAEGWHIVNLPAIKEESPIQVPVSCTLEPDWRQTGEALCPERYPADKLLKRMKRIGAYFAAALYQQRPQSIEGNLFKRDWIRFWTPETLPKDLQMLVISTDCSFKDEASSKTGDVDYVVSQLWGRRWLDAYLVDQRRGKVDVTGTIQQITELRAGAKVSAVYVEDKANGAAVISFLHRQMAGVVAVQPLGGKTSRAFAVQDLWSSGHVYIPDPTKVKAPWVGEFIDELMRFPRGKHDDQVDAMTQALAQLSPMLHAAPDAEREEAVEAFAPATLQHEAAQQQRPLGRLSPTKPRGILGGPLVDQNFGEY